jgi:hypothetical protein
LSTLLWITLAAACWFGGMRFERWRDDRGFRAAVDAMKSHTERYWHQSGPFPDSAL